PGRTRTEQGFAGLVSGLLLAFCLLVSSLLPSLWPGWCPPAWFIISLATPERAESAVMSLVKARASGQAEWRRRCLGTSRRRGPSSPMFGASGRRGTVRGHSRREGLEPSIVSRGCGPASASRLSPRRRRDEV